MSVIRLGHRKRKVCCWCFEKAVWQHVTSSGVQKQSCQEHKLSLLLHVRDYKIRQREEDERWRAIGRRENSAAEDMLGL